MAKVELNDIGTLANPASARQALNDNFQKIEEEFEKVVYRDGSTPNSMEADLDMDSHRILNVADAVHDKDAVNKGQVADIAYEAAEVVWQPRFDDFVNHVEDELSRTLKLDGAGTYNTNGTRLRGLPYASATDEAATLGQVMDQIQTAISNPNTELFVQDGDDAVHRTVADKLRDVVNVKDFGAVGDGVADDYAAIQSAIDAASSGATSTTEVHLPAGTYNVSHWLTLKSNVHLVGVGDATVIRGKFAYPKNRIITSPHDVLQTNVAIKNLKVDRTEPNSQHGIILGGIDGLLIENVHVYGFGPGVMSGALGVSPFGEFARLQSSNVTVRNCTITQANNFGIAFGNVRNGRIVDNMFVDCWRECIGLEAWGDGTSDKLGVLGVVENCIASGNTIYIDTRAGNHVGGFPGPAVFVGGASSGGKCINSIVSNNTIYITNTDGITGYAGIIAYGSTTLPCEGCAITNNTVVGAPGAGIQLGIAGYITRNLTVTGNTIIGSNSAGNEGASGSAIYVRSLTGSIVSNNKIVGSTHTYGVSDDANCSNNTFLDNESRGHTLLSYLQQSMGRTTVFRDPLSYTSTPLGDIIQDAVVLADGEEVILRPRGGACRCLAFVSSNLGGNYAILLFNGGLAPTVISKSSDVIVGETNPNVANALNVFPVPGNRIGLKNNMGLTRTVQVITFGVK